MEDCFKNDEINKENPEPIFTKKQWGVYQDNENFYSRGWVHVMPIEDSKEHKMCIDCHCEPTVDFNIFLVTHNAYDFRDAEEFAQTPIRQI